MHDISGARTSRAPRAAERYEYRNYGYVDPSGTTKPGTEVTTQVTTMNAIRVRDRQRKDITYESMPVSEPRIGDVLVQVEAASFTPTELDWPSTWVNRVGQARAPAVPGHEVAGVVASLGYGTSGFEVGDRVYGITDWYRDGAAAEFAAVEARNLARRPNGLGAIDAAAFPLAGLTAWQALFVHGRLEKGQTVIIFGPSGGVGSLAVQLAHWADARVVAIAHRWAWPLLSDLGADECFEADDLSSERVDVVFDTVGGDAAERLVAAARDGGAFVSVVAPDPPLPAEGRAVFFVVEPDRGQLIELAELVVAGRICPVTGAVIGLVDAAEKGFGAKQAGGIPGKIVLTPPSVGVTS